MFIIMKSIVKNPFFYSCLIFGALLGLSFPILFIFLDLKQLGLDFKFNNMYEVFKSQNIYVFSSILFPLLFSAIGGLYFYITTQNKLLGKGRSYINNILNSLNDCIIVTDSEGVIQYSNQAWSVLYENEKKSFEELLGITHLNTVSRGKFIELSFIASNGEKRFMNYIVYKLNNQSHSKEDDHYILSIRDIDDVKKNEQIIVSQREQLFEASKLSALGEMASGFAHEINNPLAIIKGKLTLTEREVKKDEINKDSIFKNLETCKVTVDRITKIIVGLRNLAHGSIELENEKISVKDLIEDAVVMATLKMSGKGIDFVVDIQAVENEALSCNRIQISQVLINLLGNAIDAIENLENPWLKFSVEAYESEIKFIITDSGNGIPMEVQKRMFDPMFSTKPVGKGTGLGLSITRAIIEKHQGKIQINNNCPNTSFEILLPRESVVEVKAA